MNDIPRRFVVERTQDISGVSGIGIVASGVVFPSGKAVMEWLTFHSSMTVFQNVDDITKIHGHGGATTIKFIDEENVSDNKKGQKRNSRSNKKKAKEPKK